MEKTCKWTTKGLKQKGLTWEEKLLKWTNGIASCTVWSRNLLQLWIMARPPPLFCTNPQA